MTTTMAVPSITASAFLFDDDKDSVKALADALEKNGVLGSLTAALAHLSRAGLGAVGEQVATVAHGLLDLDLGDLVMEGWHKYEDLLKAAERTVATPDSSEVLDLATHSIASTHKPHVDVFVDDTKVATVRFELSVKFTVKGVVATVRGGRLVELQSGVCDLVGTLAAQGKELAKREGHYELPLLVHLGDGILLLRGSQLDPAASATPAKLDG